MATVATIWGDLPLGRESSANWQLETKRARSFKVIAIDGHYVAVEVMWTQQRTGTMRHVLESHKIIGVRHSEQAADAICH